MSEYLWGFFIGWAACYIMNAIRIGPLYRLTIYDRGWFPNGFRFRRTSNE